MEEQKPRRVRNQRGQTRRMEISITNWKEFMASKLEYKLPEGYQAMSKYAKKQAWRNLVQILKNQTKKACYLLSDKMSEDEVNLIIEVVEQEKLDDSIDYEYEELFLGNKKQLLVYIKFKDMISYLEKYRLPQGFDPALRQVEKFAKALFELKIQRNIVISLHDQEKVNNLNIQAKKLEDGFQKEFEKFLILMKKIFVHFESQKNRTVIGIEIIRCSIYEKLKSLANEFELFICSKYPDTENDEFLFVEVRKKNEFDLYFDNQNLVVQDQEEKCDSDASSVISDLSEEEKEMKMQTLKRKVTAPSGIRSIKFENYSNQDKKITLRIELDYVRNQFEAPTELQYGLSAQNLKEKIEINDFRKDLIIQLPLQNAGFISYAFRTRNEIGNSQIKNFKFNLRLDSQRNILKNGFLNFIGEDKYLIPPERSTKVNDISRVSLVAVDVSISSTHVQVCDMDGNSADWGLFKRTDNENKEVVEKNQIFSIVNNKNNMYYQEPTIILDRNYKIVKIAAGSGYGMLLDAFGTVWVFGKNTCGQLGVKEQLIDDIPIEIKFFRENNIFITDIKTSESLASFAIDSTGTLYKWGTNQCITTNYPIYDRFGTVMNYSLQNSIQEQWTPLPVKKHFETERIIQIEAGNEFYLSLNNCGTLYGWGECRNLGKGVLKDGKDEEIANICNDIELMNGVLKVSAGKDHAIVLNSQKKILGWGNLSYLSNQKKDFSYTPVDLTEQYGETDINDHIVCGPSYTCLYKAKEGKIKLFGQIGKFSKNEFEIKEKVRKIQCGQTVIALVTQNP